MTFSLKNPDVDPLSQNQRLNTLETFSPGGGGAGGGSPYQVPDFDLYPDNTIKVYPDVGLVGKISIPDSAQMFPGLEFKVCWYTPLINGVPLGKRFFVMRQHNAKPWTFSSSAATNPISKYFHCDFEKFVQEYFANITNLLIYSISFVIDVPFKVGAATYTMQTNFSMTGSVIQPPRPGNSSITLSGRVSSSNVNAPASLTLPAGYRFTFYISDERVWVQSFMKDNFTWPGQANYEPGPIFSPRLTVTSLQDIPTVYKAFYPKSWTT